MKVGQIIEKTQWWTDLKKPPLNEIIIIMFTYDRAISKPHEPSGVYEGKETSDKIQVWGWGKFYFLGSTECYQKTAKYFGRIIYFWFLYRAIFFW